MQVRQLRPTSWLAKRLGLSISTIERLRSQGGDVLPPHVIIGRHSIRYDEAVVDEWIAKRLQASVRDVEPVAPARWLRRIGNKVIAVGA